MRPSNRHMVVAVVLATGALNASIWAQGAPPQGTPPPTQPAGQGGGRRGGPGGDAGRPGGPGRVGGQRRGGFTQFTRQLAPQDVLVRGKSLYEANCSTCHAPDLRGGDKGTNLLRSGVALTDQHGELVAQAVAKHTPALTLATADTTAIAEYIHSVHATMGGQGSPPGRNPTDVRLNVLVGDPRAGEGEFSARCAGCHTGTKSLNGIGSKIPDPRALQNAWFVGSSSTFGGFGGFGGGGGAGNPVTVTMANGTKIEGTLVRQDDWLVIVKLSDGSRQSIPRTSGMKIDVKDPKEAHKGVAMKLVFDDPDNRKMHDITAYLATLK